MERRAYHRRAVASVIGLDLPAVDCSVHVLVVDDGSTDDLTYALRRFGAQVSCIRLEPKAGAVAARNTGKSDNLAFLDSDDVWLLNKPARQIAFMSAMPPVALHGIWRRLEGPISRGPATKAIYSKSPTLYGMLLEPGHHHDLRAADFRAGQAEIIDTKLQRPEDWDWLLRPTTRYDLVSRDPRHLEKPDRASSLSAC